MPKILWVFRCIEGRKEDEDEEEGPTDKVPVLVWKDSNSKAVGVVEVPNKRECE